MWRIRKIQEKVEKEMQKKKGKTDLVGKENFRNTSFNVTLFFPSRCQVVPSKKERGQEGKKLLHGRREEGVRKFAMSSAAATTTN